MELMLTILATLPEAARLALIGFSLISAALVLRFAFFRHPAALDSSASKVEVSTK